MPAELSAAERTTIASIVGSIRERDVRRRSALRSGWALLIGATLSLPVIAGALDGSITITTAVMRIAIALGLSVFVTLTVGSLMDNYRTQAALNSVESALLTARQAAADAEASARRAQTPEPETTDL